MNAFEAIALIAEGKIREALENGAFDHLPGAGKPLVLEDLSHLPPETRLAYTILKNSGFVGPGRKTPFRPEEELARSAPEEGDHSRRLRRLDLLLRRVRRGREAPDGALPVLPDSPYLAQLLRHLSGPSSTKDAPATERPEPSAKAPFTSRASAQGALSRCKG
ncbi:MAG: DUF1992 domain-containing protein [Desulfovibrio sp.]|jgi:hypothetical protein|nr:DUF1992 domain-containing protein [Desulfovibrio sp.]